MQDKMLLELFAKLYSQTSAPITKDKACIANNICSRPIIMTLLCGQTCTTTTFAHLENLCNAQKELEAKENHRFPGPKCKAQCLSLL